MMRALSLRCLCTAACMFTLAGSLSAQTVQLPTYSFFTTSTSVSVPDRGGTHLGGVTRSSQGSSEFGPFPRGRAFGSSTTASSMHVIATIHDLRELDEAVLDAAGGGTGLAGGRSGPLVVSSPVRVQPAFAGGTVSSADQPAGSLADIRREKSALADQSNAVALAKFAEGQAAEAAGKLGAARIYYRQAAKLASGDLKAEVLARLQGVSSASSRVATQPE